IISQSARLEFDAETGQPKFANECLAIVNEHLSTDGPDLIVDASGRKRLFSNMMKIPSRSGTRSDAVLFAHLDSADTTVPGHIHIGRLRHGWNWFIPLPGRMSVGFVMNHERLKEYGDSNEERYDNLLRTEPAVKRYITDPKRLTPVMKYTNYQWVSNRLAGDDWALVGDAAGFIDPVFSSGLYLGMDGAVRLAEAIEQGGASAFKRYESEYFSHIRAWQRIVDYYYSGELFTLFVTGRDRPANWFTRPFRSHVHRHMGRIFTGQAVTQSYSLRLLDFMVSHAIKSTEVAALKIN
ncbi:MAG: tryptophan 7-halogenase, partial [Candidatus Hydrogenedentota bacterium]